MAGHASPSSTRRRRPSLEPLLPPAPAMAKHSVRDAVQVAAHAPQTERDQKLRHNLEQFEQLFGTDEDAFEQPTTTRKELWSYYLYYNGDNGVGPGSYSQTL